MKKNIKINTKKKKRNKTKKLAFKKSRYVLLSLFFYGLLTKLGRSLSKIEEKKIVRRKVKFYPRKLNFFLKRNRYFKSYVSVKKRKKVLFSSLIR